MHSTVCLVLKSRDWRVSLLCDQPKCTERQHGHRSRALLQKAFFHLSHLRGASCYIRLLFRAVAAAPAWLWQLLGLAHSSWCCSLSLFARRVVLSTSVLAAHGWRAGWHKAGFVLQHLLVLAGKTFGSLKPLRPSLVLCLFSIFWLKIFSELWYIL